MSRLMKLFSKWDGWWLARKGDPVMFRNAASETLQAAKDFNAERTEEALVVLLDRASAAICRSLRGESPFSYRAVYRALLADYPEARGSLNALLRPVCDRFYNREVRNTSTQWTLLVACQFEIARVRQSHGLLRFFSGAWWSAVSKSSVANEFLRAEFRRKNPQTVYVEEVVHVHQSPMGVPSYKGW